MNFSLIVFTTHNGITAFVVAPTIGLKTIFLFKLSLGTDIRDVPQPIKKEGKTKQQGSLPHTTNKKYL
jgi:hypothetical protein